MTPSLSAAASARSSTIGPRAVFTSTAVGRIRKSAAASIRWCLSGGGEVDVVDADRVVRDDPQLRAHGVEVVAVDPRRQQRKDTLGATRLVDQLEPLAERVLDRLQDRPGDVNARLRRSGGWHGR